MPTTDPNERARRPRLRERRNFWPVVALLVILGLNLAIFPQKFLFVREGRLFGTLSEVLQQGSTVMILAVGMTLVIATAGIDLSVGSVMAICGAVAALLLTRTSLPLAGVLAVALVVGGCAGLWNGLLVAFLGLQPIVATLILLVAGRGVAQLLTSGQIITFKHPAFEFIATGHFLGVPFPLYLVVLVAGATMAATRFTVAGLYVEAVGNNERASRLAGLRPGLVKLLVYGFSGLCAAVAGLVETSYISAADINKCGEYIELDAILAVVIGGTPFTGGRANIVGSLIGAAIMQALSTTIQMLDVPAAYTLVVKALTVVAVCSLGSERFRRAVRRLVPASARAR